MRSILNVLLSTYTGIAFHGTVSGSPVAIQWHAQQYAGIHLTGTAQVIRRHMSTQVAEIGGASHQLFPFGKKPWPGTSPGGYGQRPPGIILSASRVWLP